MKKKYDFNDDVNCQGKNSAEQNTFVAGKFKPTISCFEVLYIYMTHIKQGIL